MTDKPLTMNDVKAMAEGDLKYIAVFPKVDVQSAKRLPKSVGWIVGSRNIKCKKCGLSTTIWSNREYCIYCEIDACFQIDDDEAAKPDSDKIATVKSVRTHSAEPSGRKSLKKSVFGIVYDTGIKGKE